MAGYKDFNTMKSNVGNVIGDTSSGMASKIGVYLNDTMFDIIRDMSANDAPELERSVTIATTAATSRYQMPGDFKFPVYIHDDTNNQTLDLISEQEWANRFGKNLTAQGQPICAVLEGDSIINIQPVSSSKIVAVSTNGGDTTQNAVVKGISGSATIYETFALAGTATAISVNSYDYLLNLAKDGTTSGVITLTYGTSTGSIGVVLDPDTTEKRYAVLRFHYVPAGTYSITIRYRLDIRPLVKNNDFPVLDIADIMELGAEAKSWREKRQFGKFATVQSLFEEKKDQWLLSRSSWQMNQMIPIPYPRADTY